MLRRQEGRTMSQFILCEDMKMKNVAKPPTQPKKSKKDATFKSRPEESSTSAQRVPIAHVVVVVPTPSVESVAQVPPQSNQSATSVPSRINRSRV
ncbi:hypothetical protein AAZX31_19G078500 [Glycine max]